MKNRKEINKIRRNNAKLYSIYKMFSWDLLFFYSIEFSRKKEKHNIREYVINNIYVNITIFTRSS